VLFILEPFFVTAVKLLGNYFLVCETYELKESHFQLFSWDNPILNSFLLLVEWKIIKQ